jgi:branched-chain amino acid transport system ATP-binding protein
MSVTRVLEVKDLELSFGAVKACDGLSLTLSQCDALYIVGPNGAGKTTLLNVISGYLTPQAGHVLLDEEDVTALGPRQLIQRGMGRSFQIPQLFEDLTILEHLLLAVSAQRGTSNSVTRALYSDDHVADAEEIAEFFQLLDICEMKASVLAEGQRKVLDIATAFARKPRLLLMDEPTSGVSIDDKRMIMHVIHVALRAANVSAICVEHDMDVVSQYATQVAILSGGKIVTHGSPDETLDEFHRIITAH